MNTFKHKGPTGLTVCALALLAMVAFGWTSTAEANSSADATILNVVQVDFSDASGTQSYSATASSTVTVNLVESDPVLSGQPTGASPGATAALPADQTVASGATASYVYALTATANGVDTYDLARTIDTTSGVTGQTVTYKTITPAGADLTTGNPATVDLGAAVAIGQTGGDTIQFPGGALSGFAVGDIVVVGGIDYEVAAVSVGNAPAHDNVGGVAHLDVGADTAEVLGTLQLVANANGSNTAPNFAASDPTGLVVAEQVLIQVAVTATADTLGTNGTVQHTFSAEYDGGTGTSITATNTTTFQSVDLAIQKDVRNATDSGAFGASATGDPGDILEYRLTITNGSGDATDVTITDNVPAYTTLVVFSDSYDGTVSGGFAATDLFAQATNDGGTTTVDITTSSADSEAGDIAEGNATGDAAGDTLTIYVGAGSTNSAGGTVDNATTYEIYYQVQID